MPGAVQVAPFWAEVIRSALTSEGIAGLLKAGWTTIKVVPGTLAPGIGLPAVPCPTAADACRGGMGVVRGPIGRDVAMAGPRES